MSYNPLDPEGDPFHPPAQNVEVSCLHCGEIYDSYRVEWRVVNDIDGQPHGFWCCPIAGCDGKGFGFDILPTDPNYQDEHGGWIHDDDCSEDEDYDELMGDEPPPHKNGEPLPPGPEEEIPF